MWQILLILQPAGNGGPGGEDGVWEKEDGARRNLFGKSRIEPARKFQAGAKCDGWRVAEERGVKAGSRLHLFHTLVTIQPNAGRSK